MHLKFHRNNLRCDACGRHNTLMLTYRQAADTPVRDRVPVMVVSCWRPSCRRLVTAWPR